MDLHITPTVGALVALPPPIALLGTLVFVGFLFRRDVRQRPNVTGALWLPFVWMVIIASRSPTQWLQSLHFPISGNPEDEGNPLDALIYFTLILAGLWVLNQRQIDFGEVIRNNGWLFLFLFYCFIAISWSDFPLSSFKRWIKVLGHPIMVLVLFTEPDFNEAVARLIKRSAYVLVPFSILTIKYYPEIGRTFLEWGTAVNRGVTLGKNGLGGFLMVLGLFFLWHFLRIRRAPRDIMRRNELRLILLFAVMMGYLWRKAHAASSFICFVLGAALMLLLGQRWVNKKLIGTYVIVAVIAFITADAAFGILDVIVDVSGHEATLNGRRQLWAELLALDTNPLFGVGFESFWLGPWVDQLAAHRAFRPNEAHNGYLETYLNLGLIGLLLLLALLVATFLKVRASLLTNLQWGRLRFGVLVAVIFNNWTEAKFRGLSLVWFVFYIIAIDYPRVEYESSDEHEVTSDLHEESALAYASDRIPHRSLDHSID